MYDAAQRRLMNGVATYLLEYVRDSMNARQDKKKELKKGIKLEKFGQAADRDWMKNGGVGTLWLG